MTARLLVLAFGVALAFGVVTVVSIAVHSMQAVNLP